MARVVVENVSKLFAGPKGEEIRAVNQVSLAIEDREFLVLVGPSGCGKSTTLRMIAGLEEVSRGTISIDGRVVNDVPPKDRDIAMVFQNYALYPHMTVYENMAFGLKLRRFPKEEIVRRVQEAAEILGLTALLDRKPKALSGGQRQRVAVGRAIVRKPKVFLFDEPLSNLDAQMRVQMRAEISKLHRRLEATMIYVTHDQTEAMTMGDRIAVMQGGVVRQVADPLTLYRRPANLFVAAFIGSPPMNFFRGRVVADGGVLSMEALDTEPVRPGLAWRLRLPAERTGALQPFLGREVVLGVRPEHIRPATDPRPSDSVLAATVELIEPMGAETHWHLRSGRQPFIVRVSSREPAGLRQEVNVVFETASAQCFDPATGLAVAGPEA